MYNYDNNLIFVTICIGDEYLQKVDTLIQSVCKFTSSRLFVYTDNVSYFDEINKFYGKQLIIKNINENNNFPLEINQIFNYHLKHLPFVDTIDEPEAMVFYIDCDSFLFGWDSGYSRALMDYEDGILARCRENLSTCDSLKSILQPKEEEYKNSGMNISFAEIEQPLILENAFIIHKGPKSINFITEWKKISEFAIEHKISPFIEAVEIAMVLQTHPMNIYNLTSKMPFSDTIRTLHGNKLISTWII